VQPAIPFTARDFLPDLMRGLTGMFDTLTGLTTLQGLYEQQVRADYFPSGALRTLGIDVDCSPNDLERIPAAGPLVVCANHPHGAADGLALAHALRTVRRDVKLLGTELLGRIPEMREHLIAVDAFRLGMGRNRGAMRAAIEWVREGHCLVVFPAGEVSHVRTSDGRIVDGVWRDGVSRIAAQAEAPVVPAYIEGRNSAMFVAAGLVNAWLRTLMLPRELLRLRGRTIRLRAGRPIPAARLAAVGETAAQTAYLRVRTYGLQETHSRRATILRRARRADRVAAIAPAAPSDLIAREIESLPGSARLIESGAWTVFCVAGDAAPHVLQEIGRLRELTFRAAGEGTGQARDLDRYDRHYKHLFVWHRDRRQIAGAYRVAATDRVVPRHGVSGLYTRSLFRYPRKLLSGLGPALELGRSFVAPEFQRDFQPLLLLWKGIGRLVGNEPRYRVLFGPVSISAEYGQVTRDLLARFLLAHRSSAQLGPLVRAKRPLGGDGGYAADAFVRTTVASRVEEIDHIVRELEDGERGMPVLLRQYLKLNAKLLGFSVDPSFGQVLDGLIVVDLLDVEQSQLARYLGRDGAADFLAYHSRREARPLNSQSEELGCAAGAPGTAVTAA
jgi:putative hemolysin